LASNSSCRFVLLSSYCLAKFPAILLLRCWFQRRSYHFLNSTRFGYNFIAKLLCIQFAPNSNLVFFSGGGGAAAPPLNHLFYHVKARRFPKTHLAKKVFFFSQSISSKKINSFFKNYSPLLNAMFE